MLMGLVAYVPVSRMILLVLAVIGLPIAYMNREQVMDAITRSGERINVHKTIKNDGREQQLSYTNTRYFLVQHYAKAMKSGGLLGFGTEAVSEFPVKLSPGLVEAETFEKLPYIDNQYVLMTLRFGWLGVTAFTVALMVAVWAWLQRSVLLSSSHAAVSFYAGGTILAVAVGLLTVWMPHDIGFPLLWWMGAGSSSPSKRTAGGK